MTDGIKKTGVLRVVADGFEGYNDTVARGDRQIHQAPTQGVMIQFTAAARWETVHGGQVIGRDRVLIVIDVQRVVVKRVKGRRVELRVLAPGHPFPDVDAMNEAAPRAEWSEGPNGLRGPWEKRQHVTMYDPDTMDVYTFQTTDIDGFAAIRRLVDSVMAMRESRAEMLSPLVRLGGVVIKTRAGDHRRAFFDVVGWVVLEGGDPEPAVTGARHRRGLRDGGAGPRR